MTLLVIFQSQQPFELAAVVAYVACLSLTIILFTIPYFASYFINLNKRLHQIEEAVVLLSEKDLHLDSSPHKIAVPDEAPTYSAVVEMETPSLGDLYSQEAKMIEQETVDEDIEDPVIGDTSEKHEEQEPESTAAENEAEPNVVESIEASDSLVDEDTEKPTKPKKKTAEEIDEEAGQLSLLNSFFVEEETSLVSEEQIEEQEEVPEESVENSIKESADQLRTTIQAYVLLDKGNDLYVRGNSTFWKDEGLKMNLIDVGKFELLTEEIESPVEITFWLNDKTVSSDGPYRIEPGSNNEFYPEF